MQIPRLVSLVAVLALLALPVPSSVAAADEPVTVVLKNGARHERVSCRVAPAFNTVEIGTGGQLVHVSFSDIEAILDAQGNNIAPRLLGSRYRPAGAVSAGQSGARRVRLGGIAGAAPNRWPGEALAGGAGPRWWIRRSAR